MAEENLHFIWLLASEQPDFRMICDFRRRFASRLGDLLRQTIEIGVSEGVIQLEQVAVDGTIIRASAGAKTFRTRAQLEEELALQAWTRARRRLRQLQLPVEGLIIHHDRDSVYTSEAWVKRHLFEDHTLLSYALRGARDNAEMESFNGRFKVENAELFGEAPDLDALVHLVNRRLTYYNRSRRHLSLGNRTPWSVIQDLLSDE